MAPKGLRLSTEELEAYTARTGLGAEHLQATSKLGETQEARKKIAPGQTRAGEMNKTEQRFYNEIIWPQIVTKEIQRSGYEDEKFKIAPGVWYIPDFPIVWHQDLNRRKTYCEIKGGFIREKSIIKFRAAAAKFPEYSWQLWQYKAGIGWRLVHDI